MKHLRLALVLALALFALPTVSLLAEEAPAPAPTKLSQLAAQIFVPEAPPVDDLQAFLPDWTAKSHCTGSACAVWICTCQEDCAPCGIKKVTCATGVCICNPPC